MDFNFRENLNKYHQGKSLKNKEQSKDRINSSNKWGLPMFIRWVKILTNGLLGTGFASSCTLTDYYYSL